MPINKRWMEDYNELTDEDFNNKKKDNLKVIDKGIDHLFYTKDEYDKLNSQMSWDEFRETGLLQWVNQLLHTFGITIEVQVKDGSVIKAYPKRCEYRGFYRKGTEDMYIKITKFIASSVPKMMQDITDNKQGDDK